MMNHKLVSLLERLNHSLPLPEGYHYHIESNGGHGGPRYYNLAVRRDDLQGGDYIDIPPMGGFTRGMFIQYINGMLEGHWLRGRIAVLPGAPNIHQYALVHEHEYGKSAYAFRSTKVLEELDPLTVATELDVNFEEDLEETIQVEEMGLNNPLL